MINGHEPQPTEEIDTSGMLRIIMEQDGCLIEAMVPTATLPDAMYMKEYMQNTAVDMYARLRFMVANAQSAAKQQEH